MPFLVTFTPSFRLQPRFDRITPFVGLILLLLTAIGTTACGGTAAFADEPEPSVLPPTIALRPAGSASVEEPQNQSPDAAQEPLTSTGTFRDPITNKHCLNSEASVLNDDNRADAVNIGVLAPTISSAAEQAGLAMVSSANLARGDIEEAGGILGRKVRLSTGNTKGDPATARLEAERLIIEECVVGLIGVYHSAVGLEIKEVAREYGIPIIFAEPFSDDIVADRYPEVFRIGPSSTMVNLAYARWMKNVGDFNRDGVTSVTIIAENNNSAISRIESLTETLTEHDLRVKSFLVDLPETDFSSVIARIVASENLPDFVFVRFNGNSGYTLLRQLNDAAIGPANRTLVVARQNALDHDRFWQEVPNGLETVVGKIGPWHSTVTPIGQEFAERYQKIKGFWPESYAFESYDALRLMADAINRAGTTEPTALIESLENADIELASGRYCFPQGELAKQSSLQNQSEGAEEDTSCGSGEHALWHQWPYAPILFLQYNETNQPSADMNVIWPQAFQNSISTTLSSD